MSKYFIATTVRYPLNPISLDRLEVAVEAITFSMGPNHFGSLWENLSFGEDLLLEVSNHYPKDTVDYTIADGWVQTVRDAIGKRLLDSAIEIYLNNRDDITCIDIAGEKWLVTGGFVFEDGESPTSAWDHMKFISWSGLDLFLADQDFV